MEFNEASIETEDKKLLSKTKDKLKNIKSDYFLQNFFLNIRKKRILNIIKYNKLSQNRLNININDYKNYYYTYTPIEIELIIAEGKFGNFINSLNFRVYHIYFNNNKKEIKRNYIIENDKVKIINIIIDYSVF